MVANLRDGNSIGGSAGRPPLVVELVGLAGSGKSTLSRALGQQNGSIRARLGLWHVPLPLLLGSALQAFPKFVGLYRNHSWFGWDETSRIIRLNALHDYLERGSWKKYEALLLDEGAVFALAWLYGFAHESIQRPCFDEWWNGALHRWANAVDLIIWLDAPDPILRERIRTRRRCHQMKNASDKRIDEFLARWRAAYQCVISKLTAASGPRVVHLLTDQWSTEELVEKVTVALNGKNSTCRPVP